jgi:hypothetical protein
MDADTDAERSIQLTRQRLADGGKALSDRPRGMQRVATGRIGIRAETEQGHDAVSGELVDDAAGELDGGPGRLAVSVEDQHDV